MNSNTNLITNCNIYSNLQSIKIWQSSQNNTIYLNNLFKNDDNAIDEGTNQWDNGSVGNYWDLYQGKDTNHDGIGDTPFSISYQSADRFPSMSMFLENIIIAPTDIKQITSTSDPTPTFTWNPIIYSKGINGYAIAIDTSEEIIIQTPTWTSSSNLTNGVHLFAIRALGSDGQSSVTRTLRFTIDTSFNDLDHDGWSDEEELHYGSDPDNPENYPLDTDGDHVPDNVDIDDDNDGYSDEVELSYGTNMLDKNSYPTDTDGDKVPDENSPDGKYQGDIDRDDDGLPNTIENQLGSNPVNSTDSRKIYIGGIPVFLVDVSEDGIYDILYDSTSETIHAVEYADGTYRIDMNGDGSWDYLYHATDGSVTSTQESFISSPMVLLLIGIILILLAIGIFFFVKTRFDFTKKLRKLFQKPRPSDATGDSETQDMVIETRTLLNHIQQDVNTYIKILNQIEKQTSLTSLKLELQLPFEKNTGTETFKDYDEQQSHKQSLLSSQSRYDEIEAEIDKLFETLKGKNT